MFDRNTLELAAATVMTAALGFAGPAGAAVTLVEAPAAIVGNTAFAPIHVAGRMLGGGFHGGFHGGFGRFHGGFGGHFVGGGLGHFHGGFAGGFHRGFGHRGWYGGGVVQPWFDPYDDWDYDDGDAVFDVPLQPSITCQWVRHPVYNGRGKLIRGRVKWVESCS
jgi:hypothetical protein